MSYTLTVSRDELFEIQLALEARRSMLVERKKSIEDAGMEDVADSGATVRDRIKHLERAYYKVTGTRENSPALSALLTDGAGR